MKHGKNLIYGLVDPRTNLLRYVGRSTSGLSRPATHWCPSRLRAKGSTHRANWIRSVLAAGSVPKIVVLETLSSAEGLNEAERKWIRHWKSKGADLTNATEGSEGIVGWRHSSETREKIRVAGLGRRMSPKNRAAISAAVTGRVVSEETRAKLSAALSGSLRPKTAEHRAKLSAAQKGRVFSTEHLAKLSFASQRRFQKLDTQKRQQLTLHARTVLQQKRRSL